MAILTPDLNVEVYNADYRALPQIPWQQAVRLILRREVHVIGVRTPAVHVHSPSLVIELPASVALRKYVHIPYTPRTRATRDGVFSRDPGPPAMATTSRAYPRQCATRRNKSSNRIRLARAEVCSNRH
jgi:hypothetical protein